MIQKLPLKGPNNICDGLGSSKAFDGWEMDGFEDSRGEGVG